MHNRRKHSRRRSSETRRGATAVEFALVVPIVFSLFLGAVEMTRLNFIRHTASNAAYEGARAAIVPGGSSTDAVNRVNSLLTAVGANSSVDVDVVATTSAVTVTVTIPVDQNSWGLGRFSCGLNIVQSCKLSREID